MQEDSTTGSAPDTADPHGGSAPSTLRNAVVAGAMFVGRAVLAFVTTALVAKYLGAEGRGRVVFVSNLAGLLALAAASGTVTGLNRLHSVEGIASTTLVRSSTAVGIIAGVAISAVLLGVHLIHPIGSVDDAALPGTAWALLAVALVALIVFSSLSQIAALDNRIGAVTVTALIGAALYVVWSVVTAATGSITVLNNLVGWAISSILPTVLLVGVLGRSSGAPSGEPSVPSGPADSRRPGVRAMTRRLLVISVRANFASLAILAIWRVDVLLVESRRGFTELGLYSVAVALAEVVVVLAMALRSAMLPHHASGDDELAEIIVRATRLAFAGTMLLAAGLAAIGPLLLRFMFGPTYAQTYPALVLILPGTVFLVLHYPLFDYVAARGRLAALTVLGGVGVVFNVAVNYWALGRWSYVAAAVVSSLTYALVFAGCVALFVSQTGRTVRETVLLRRSDLTAVADLVRGFRGRKLAGADRA